EGVWVLRVDGPLLFPGATCVRQRVLRTVERRASSSNETAITHVVLDCTSVSDIDTTAIHALGDMLGLLHRRGAQLALSNPSSTVLRKLALSGFLQEMGEEWLFLSASEAVEVCQSGAKNGGV
ncbi:hypothetical protein CLOM_g3090, partial [Closterium sp. NIES-68]